MASSRANQRRDYRGRFAPNTGRQDPKTGPIFPDVSTGFSAIVQVALDVLDHPDIAIRTNRPMAEQMLRDPVVKGPLMKRFLATAQLPWQIVPEDEDDATQIEQAKLIESVFRRTPKKVDFIQDLAWGVFKGTGVSEINWQFFDDIGMWGVGSHRPHDGDKILFTRFGEPRIRIRTNQTGGRELTPSELDRLVIHIYNREDGSFWEPAEAGYVYKGRGIRDDIWQFWWLKQNALKFWVRYIERFGSGFVLGRYPMGNAKAEAAMKSVLKNLMNNSKVTLPVPGGAEDKETYGVELVEQADKAGTSDLFVRFVEDYCGKHIRMVIEGQQEQIRESGDGLGSGRSDAMQDIFRMYRDYDAQSIGETITEQVIRRIQRFNGMPDLPLRFQFVLPKDDYDQQEARFKAAKDMGLAVVKRDIYEGLGLKEPGRDVTDEDVIDFGAIQAEQAELDRQARTAGGGPAKFSSEHADSETRRWYRRILAERS